MELLRFQAGQFFASLLAHRGFPAAGEETLVVEDGDLALELAGGPMLTRRLVQVPLACGGIFNTEQQPVVRPGKLRPGDRRFITRRVMNSRFGTQRVQFPTGFQFITHCVMNWKHQVELAHVAQVRNSEPPAELGGEHGRQAFQQGFAIAGAPPPALFVLDDQPPHLPVRADHGDIDGPVGRGARLLQHRPDFAVKRIHLDGAAPCHLSSAPSST